MNLFYVIGYVLLFKVVNVWGFWGPAETRGNQKIKIKVIPSIFMKFWSRNNLDKLDRLTPQDVYKVLQHLWRRWQKFSNFSWNPICHSVPILAKKKSSIKSLKVIIIILLIYKDLLLKTFCHLFLPTCFIKLHFVAYSVSHNFIAPSKELCSIMALGKVGVSLPWWYHALVLPVPGYWGLF